MKLEDLLDVLPGHAAVAIAAVLQSVQIGDEDHIDDHGRGVVDDALGVCSDYRTVDRDVFWRQVVEVIGETGGLPAIMRGCAAGAKPGYKYP